MQIDSAFARHVNLDLDLGMEVEVDDVNVVGKMNLQVDGIARLMLFDPKAAAANLVMIGSDARLDRVLIPGVDVDVGVGRFHAQVGLSRDGIRFRPLLRAREWSGCQAKSQYHQGKTFH